MGFENMGFEQLNQQRAESEEENRIRAEERNKHRPIGQKLTLKGKVSGLDMAQEEALKINEEADKLVRSGEAAKASEAVEKLEAKGEFGLKGKERIEKEEHARAGSLKVIERLRAGDLEKAFQLLHRSGIMATDYDKETKRLLGEYVKPFVKARVIEDLEGKNGDDLIKLLDRFRTYSPNIGEFIPLIEPSDLSGVPEDALKSPEIRTKIQEDLIKNLEQEPGTFGRNLDKYSEFGFLTREEVVQMPEIRQAARKVLERCPMREEAYTNSPTDQLSKLFREATFDEMKKVCLENDLLTEEEIEQIRTERAARRASR